MILESYVASVTACCIYKFFKTKKMAEDTMVDELTKMYNRKIIKKIEANDLSGKYSVVAFDIDHFKVVNDTYGHHAGDIVLRVVAETIMSSFKRKMDYCVRCGGEEFFVYVNSSAGMTEERLHIKADEIRKSIKALNIIAEGSLIKITTSIGVSFYDGGLTLDQRQKDSDKKLYHAKHNGRDQVCCKL